MRDGVAIVGVDAGGSGTTAACERAGRRFVSSRHDPANPTAYGVERAVAAIEAAIADALQGQSPAAIAVGAAGAGREAVAAAMHGALARRFPHAKIAVADDARIALRGSVPEGDGIVLVAGTGSIAYGELGGAAYRAGGYGFALGDDGSGHAIGAAALRLLLRHYEGRVPRDAFLEAIEARLDVSSASAVLERVYGSASPIAAIAAIAPVAIERAGAGDRSAVKIVQAAAQELFELVRAVWRAAGCGQRTVPVALCGGLLRENSMLTFLLETRIANELPLAEIRKGGAALDGALAIARALAGTA